MRSHAPLLPLVALAVLASLASGLSADQLPPIGLTVEGAQWFVDPEPDQFEAFGKALAFGDFNGDGADDLATGAPYDFINGEHGSVVVRYGIRGVGLGPVTTILRGDGNGGRFGWALAAGDFNGDGFDDLAVGDPLYSYAGGQRGAVYVYYGLANGLQLDGVDLVDESLASAEHLCYQSNFGQALAVGDFDGDPYDDLAIGVPDGCERVGPSLLQESGSVVVAHGQAGGLLPFYGYRISKNSFGLAGDAESGDYFGWAVATGDFNHDGYGDLAIGIPGKGGSSDHGAVQIIMGSQWVSSSRTMPSGSRARSGRCRRWTTSWDGRSR